jgi:hypothetical protein
MTYRKIILPHPTDDVIKDIMDSVTLNTEIYTWIPASELVQEWCKKHISPDMYWGIQIITGTMPKHSDIGTTVKFNYILRTGGDHVLTGFYDGDKLIETVNFSPYTWYLMDVSIPHSVVGVESTRISITGRVFPKPL